MKTTYICLKTFTKRIKQRNTNQKPTNHCTYAQNTKRTQIAIIITNVRSLEQKRPLRLASREQLNVQVDCLARVQSRTKARISSGLERKCHCCDSVLPGVDTQV